ncbi:glycosyltransferase family 4 protein [Alishewanella sp. 16-MA]|uniref:Glycosyltransferase family 4 protein n=1 Tax=Alishewanella maricola TaxID=2795740 RepID=A0ABS8C3G5_9ALTE|nr:glycosyltransferase family 4 protein [Alishewanella maricola]MCB5226723.1 glycosyltransferase family 4 protein [Alishewanella maricola]
MSENTLNILHIVCSLELGGAERFAIDLCNIQKEHKHSSAIFSLGKQTDALVSEATDLNISVYHFPKINRLQKYRFFLDFVKKNNIQVLHLHSPNLIKFLLPILWFLAKKIKIVYTRHGAGHYSSSSWKLIHQLTKQFIHVVTFVSDDARDIFLKHHEWKNYPTKVIKNGIIVPNQFDRAKQDSPILRVASIGRMDPIKGQIYLLQAFADMQENKRKNFELHFFGHGSEYQRLKNFVEQHLTSMAVIFHGIIKDRERIYSAIDLQVVCSKNEGLSLAIMEGMARAIPAIATDVGGNPELVKNEQTGLLYPFSDTVSLGRLLVELNENRDYLRILGLNAHSFIVKDYSLELTFKQYNEVYNC